MRNILQYIKNINGEENNREIGLKGTVVIREIMVFSFSTVHEMPILTQGLFRLLL